MGVGWNNVTCKEYTSNISQLVSTSKEMNFTSSLIAVLRIL